MLMGKKYIVDIMGMSRENSHVAQRRTSWNYSVFREAQISTIIVYIQYVSIK